MSTLIPFVIQDALLMAGLIASFSLFIGVKREMRRQARRYQQALREMEELLPKLRAATLPEVDSRRESVVILPPGNPPVRSGFNLQRRVQALRLLRRGEDIAHVSAALGVARGEIELLIRVQRLAATRPIGSV